MNLCPNMNNCIKIALFLLAISYSLTTPALGADTITTPTGSTSDVAKGTEGARLDIDFTAARTEFDAAYQELVKTSPEAAEYMKREFEACERGEFHFNEVERAFVENMDRTEAKSMFESAYQEALANGDTLGAEMMKTQFEAFERGEMPVMSPEHMQAEFDRVYQDALAQDPVMAEKMLDMWKDFNAGDMHGAMGDPNEIEGSFHDPYQEALANDPSAADRMAAEFEKYQNDKETFLQDQQYDNTRAQHCLENPNDLACQPQP